MGQSNNQGVSQESQRHNGGITWNIDNKKEQIFITVISVLLVVYILIWSWFYTKD